MLTVAGLSPGNLSDGMLFNNGWGFTTYDADNDPWWGNCASQYGGGFWYGVGGGDACGRAGIITGSPANTGFHWNNPVIGGFYDLNTLEAHLLCP